MLIILACAVIAILQLAPESPISLALRRILVETPARWLSELTLGRLVLAGLIAALIGAVIAIAKTEGGPLVAQGMPEAMGWILTLDVASYVDALAIAFLLAANVRLKAVTAMVRALVDRAQHRRPARSARARRRRRPRPPSSANDDEPALFPVAA